MTIRYDPEAVEKKWRERWAQDKIFEANPKEGMKKFFPNFPYPYMNGYMHLGHAFTLLRVDILSRYKRMKGYNVMLPFAFHCTGTPIVAAANRIKEEEPEQLQIMKSMDIPEEDIPNFKDPVYWTKFFPKEYKKDLIRYGISVDWRRSFITTSENPYYDRFVRWQFNKLKEKNYVVLGEHPVIWCPKENAPVSDHARLEGEGETPQEFTLLKFKFEDAYIIAATLRPETVYGQTNMWVDPDYTYAKAKVDGETWIVGRECAEKLKEQGKTVEVVGEIKGSEMVGRFCVAPHIHKEIMILPSRFTDPNKGTGLVTSVPSDAPDDWAALRDLQMDEEECKKHGLDCEKVKEIEPIAIITSDEWGEFPAVRICEEMGIESQNDRKKLLKAKKVIYKSGFYTGVMNENCGKHSGMKVEDAKEQVKEEMIENGEADFMWEPSGDVVCRCLSPAIVKLVSNQWFIAYGDEEWKKLAHEALDNMKLFPEGVRKQFDHVVDWLNDWACTREFGLGTRLPWDEKWVIESLSDSTIYMSYYTISKYLEHERITAAEKLDDRFFDHVLLGEHDADAISKDTGIEKEALARMRDEFEYWYPFDIRVSGKDLVQNHLTFCVFNHIAIFPKRHWPLGFGVNGWLLIDGQKMSKSLGNFRTLRQALDVYGVDPLRLTQSYAGEGVDDPNFDSDFAKTARRRIEQWLRFAVENYGKGREDESVADRWFESVTNRIVKDVTKAMESTDFRTALKIGYFDLQRNLRWYLRRSTVPNRALMDKYIETRTKILVPFIPHVCEEIWELMGNEGFISLAGYPEWDDGRIDPVAEASEEFLRNTMEDIFEILKIIKMEPKRIVIYTAPEWRMKVNKTALEMAGEGKLDMGALIKASMEDPDIKRHGKKVPNFAKKIVPEVNKMSPEDIKRYSLGIAEKDYLQGSIDFLKSEFGCDVEIYSAEEENIYDPQDKARQAVPWRPAIYVE